MGIRVNNGAWIYTDVSAYLDGKTHWVPVSLNGDDLTAGENIFEICSTMHGKVYAMGYERDGVMYPGLRVHFCAPQDMWTTAQVPGAFEAQMSNSFRAVRPENFDGVGYYRKMLYLSQTDENESWWLHFEAADYRTEVWLNGFYVGRHEGGYTPFDILLTQYPEFIHFDAENEILVRVTDQTFGKPDDCDAINIKETLAGFLQDTRGLNYGGLWGEVSLEKRANVFIQDVFFEPDVENACVYARATVKSLYPQAQQISLTACVPDASDMIQASGEVPPYGTTEMTLCVPLLHVQLWSAETPYLYIGKVTLQNESGVLDTFEDTFGIRSITMQDGKFVLNGRNIFFTGALHWGMYWDTYTPACSVERIESEIRALKVAGFNSVKFCAVLPPDYVLDVYDRMGMYVYIEYPIWEPNETDAFFERCYLQMMEMVKKDRNHPCVIASDFSCELWSFSFEMEELLKWCVSEAQNIAPNRLFTDASSNGQHKFGDFGTAHPYYQQNGFDDMVTFWTQTRNASPDNPAKYTFYGLSRIKASTPYAIPIVFGEFADTKVMRNVPALRQTVSESITWYYDRFGIMDAFTLLRRSGLTDQRAQELIEASVLNAQELKRSYIDMSKKNATVGGLYITHITDLQNGTAFGLLDDTGTFRFDSNVFSQSAAETALLLDCDSYNYWAGETYSLRAEISHYSATDISHAVLQATLLDQDGNTVCAQTVLDNLSLPVRDYYSLSPFTFSFPAVEETACYTLRLTLLQDEAVLAQNEWKVWAYPQNTLTPADGQHVFVHDPDALFNLQSTYPWITAWDATEAKADDILVTTEFAEEMLNFVKRGGSCIYLGAFGSPISASISFNWDRSAMTYLPNDLNDIASDLHSGSYGGLQFNELMTTAVLALPAGTAYETVIGKFDYDSPYLSAYMIEMEVEQGKLLQSTLRHDQNERNYQTAGNELNFESMRLAAGENALGMHLLERMISHFMNR